MDKENLDYLNDKVKFMGFGEKLQPELESQLQSGAKEFQLQYGKENGKLEATLHFKKSENSERVYFNRYEAKIITEQGEERQHEFPLNKGKGVTLREAENLLQGRSVYKELVNKENQPYKAWLQLDIKNRQEDGKFTMKQYHDNYGYNLENTIQQLPVRLENDQAKEALLKTLQKGNIAMATFSQKGQERKVHLEAAPQFKNIVIYDEHMKREFQQHKEQVLSQGKEEKREIKPERHQEKKQQQEVLQVENKRSKGRGQSR